VNDYVFDRAPRRVYWELTRACDLACRHCRASAVRERAANELTFTECQSTLRALAAVEPPRPHVVFTGGDPLKRPDLVDVVRSATAFGLGVSVSPSATERLTADAIADLKAAGVAALSLSLDGPTAAVHDGVRGVAGCFTRTVGTAADVVAAGIPLQINTLVTEETEPYLEAAADVVTSVGADRWSLFFLVSIGRGRQLSALDPWTAERRLRWLAANARAWPFTATTTEAPFFRRVVIQRMRARGRSDGEIASSPAARGWGIRDGNGVMFIAANGDVTPSGFLPLVAGNVRSNDPLDIYRDSALFRALRVPAIFAGRCGRCEFRDVCGGARSRAWAASGDMLGEDPLCAYRLAGRS
jgi:radical SAM protein